MIKAVIQVISGFKDIRAIHFFIKMNSKENLEELDKSTLHLVDILIRTNVLGSISCSSGR